MQRFTADGELVSVWGEAGADDGQFDLPWGVGATPDGGVLVADWRNDRVQKFSADGEHQLTLGESGGADGKLSRPSGAAADADGNIYVADWGNERVQIFSPEGAHQATLRGQATLSAWAKDYFSANPDEWEVREIDRARTRNPARTPADALPRLIANRAVLLGPRIPSAWIPKAGCTWWRRIGIGSRCTGAVRARWH